MLSDWETNLGEDNATERWIAWCWQLTESEWERESGRERPQSSCLCACVCVRCSSAWHMCEDKINVRVKGELPRTAEAERGKERSEKESGSPAQLLLSLQCCRVAKSQTERERVQNNNKKKPAGSVYGFHCMAHAMWLGKKYAIFENYTQCSSLAPHMRYCFNTHTHGALCSAADRFSDRESARERTTNERATNNESTWE